MLARFFIRRAFDRQTGKRVFDNLIFCADFTKAVAEFLIFVDRQFVKADDHRRLRRLERRAGQILESATAEARR